MKLVTQTEEICRRLGDENGIRCLCENGYDGIDYSMFHMHDDDCVLNQQNYKEHVLNLKSIADSYGVSFEQSHAPFASARENDEEYNAKMKKLLVRSIEVAGLLDAKIIVVHPVFYSERKFEQNMELYHFLEPYAADCGVKIALENMWGRGKVDGVERIIPNVCSVAEEFNEYVDALNPDHFTACLDIGHCGLVGDDAERMIRSMGSRLGCLHIHDNDNIHDSHTLPYMMDLDWNGILKSLADIDYRGNFTYEADNFLKGFPEELLPTAVKFMSDVGRYMMSVIDGYRYD